ncbi:NAD(P)-dependent oxidoreductase [Nioella aestuarii]|uniref:NAD(P)-dependent oxidoreductase n=1 Tax=Nioella aestuarii TaxID=1662864 RepID=UPI003D7F4FE3
MKLVILGANGRTGSLVIRHAINKGAMVTAVVRSDAKRPQLRHERLSVVIGDPCDPAFLTGVFRGQDAVISTLGGRMPTKHATAIYPRSAESIVHAAWETGLKRVVVTSTALLFPSRWWGEALLATLVRNVVTRARRMEQIFAASSLDVTVARCGFLTDADETAYRALEGALPMHGSSIARNSLAIFLLDCAMSPQSGFQVMGASRPLS